MAEPAVGAPGGGNLDIRRLLLMAGVGLVIIVSIFLFIFRSCAASGGKTSGYTTIYSNMALKDAADTIARLKELAIPYEIREEGKAVAVPKDKADQARLGLAEKNLPAGGVVGWEIFDESKLGATDFDRRIQLIRAISGELSRTIRRIQEVEDARVQIVIPETKLFAETVAPVTASVMLRIRPDAEISLEKIKGIVHLVASSVENLQPENVTVIDNTGRILTAQLFVKPVKIEPVPEPDAALAEIKAEIEKLKTGDTLEAETVTQEAVEKVLTTEEKVLILVQAKKELEVNLSAKAQEILNRFYPPNSAIVRVNAEFFNGEKEYKQKEELELKSLSSIILVDNRIELPPDLKQATYKAIAAAMGYNRDRGDTITIQMVPFHLAVPPPEVVREKVEQVFVSPEVTSKTIDNKRDRSMLLSIWAFLAFLGPMPFVLSLAVVIVVFVLRRFLSKKEEKVVSKNITSFEKPPIVNTVHDGNSAISNIRSAAQDNPEKIADMLKKWLSE